MAANAWCQSQQVGPVCRITAGGVWTLPEARTLESVIARVQTGRAQEAEIDLGEVARLDTTGAWLIYRLQHRLENAGLAVRLTGAAPEQLALIARMAPPRERAALARPDVPHWRVIVEEIGETMVEVAYEGRDLLSFFGQTVLAIVRAATDPRRLRYIALAAHIEQVGLNALPIVGLLSFLIGVVLAYQGADQLRAFGAEIYAVNLLGVSALREIGVLMTAILVAGRSGAAFTAEIGVMKVNEEIDAMRVLGLDIMDVLVLPRLIAVTISLPLLAFFADLAALTGGALMSVTALDLTLTQFIEQLRGAISLSTYLVGLIKAPAFAIIIGLVGCYHGLRVEGGAESVGRLTTKAVVHAIFLVIVADAAFSILFSWLRI